MRFYEQRKIGDEYYCVTEFINSGNASELLETLIARNKGTPINKDDYSDPLYCLLCEDTIPIEEHQCNLPPALAAVVNKSIQKDEKERYSTAREFREALLGAL